MRSSKFYFVTLALLLVPALLFAQRHNIKTYSVSKGLPQAQVHDIEQTKDGYIWMATYGGGLAKFDGSNFKNYTQQDGLKDNLVEELFVDSSDDLWVATDKGGVAKFRGDSLVYPIKNDSLDHYSVSIIREFSDGNMWFGTYKGGIFILEDGEVSRLTTEDGLSSNIVWNFIEASDGTIWIATAEGISTYDGKRFKRYSTIDGLAGERVYKIIERSNQEIWIGTNNGLTVWDGKTFTSKHPVMGNDSVYDIIEASNGKIWLATRSNGVHEYEDGVFSHITEENGLSSDRTYTLFEDFNNNIWIGTDEDGANVYKEDGFLFYSEANGLPTNEVLSVFQDANDVLWAGTTEGIQSFDGKSFTTHPLPREYENNYIWNITQLPNGNMLFGMPDSTLMEYNGESYSNFTEEYNLGKLFIYDLLMDTADKLWIGSDTGLYQVDLETKQSKHYTTDDGLAENSVFHIYEDRKGTKWIGTYYGLSIFDGEKFKTLRIQDGLVHNQINYITEDDEGNIWIGTRGGISLLKSIKTNNPTEIISFSKGDGMTLLNTHFLWFGKDGSLWQGTNGGLQRLDVKTYRETGEMPITHYPLLDQGIGLEFNFQALSSHNKSAAWMGSMGGIVSLNPDRMKSLSLANLNITNIMVNSSAVKWSNYSDGSLEYHNGILDFPSVIFPHEKNIFEFEYQGISYSDPENISYRYKLEGLNNNWMSAKKGNSAVFTNLDPGDYNFKVQARVGHSDWKTAEANYQFSIATPFWQTYWFYTLMAFLFGGITYAFVQYRVSQWEKEELQQRVDNQTEHLTEALEEKEVLIKEIHHRVKNNLAVISGLLELQMDYADDTFVSRVLSESQRRVQSISMIHEKLYQNERLSEIDFEKYVRELIEVISYSFSNPDKEIQVNINIDDFKLGIDQGIPCGLILNEVVSNAYAHAFTDRDTGTIDITISLTEDQKIRLTVEDNGKGLPEGQEEFGHESLGVTLVETLGQQLEGEVSWKSDERGTTFMLEFEKENPSVDLPTT